jgi:Tfp pilus assembly protein PilF
VGMRATANGSLGFVYRQMGQSAKAKECFDTALQLAPERARARIGLGLIAQDNGDLAEAIHQFSLALAAQHSDVVYLLLAQALQQGGRSDEARGIYENVARSPTFQKARKEAQDLLYRR